MEKKLSSIGVLGGTFDPLHIGHLRPALEVQQLLGLEQIRLVPCHRTSHREQPARSSKMRCHMANLAIADISGFVVDERELRREGPSYTVDTLAEIGEEHPGVELFFLMGADSFDYFQKWHRWQEILSSAQLVVMARPGTTFCTEALQLLQQCADRIRLVQTTELGISSTAIRKQLAQGYDPRFLLPEPVRQYILEEQIYTETT